MYDNYIDTIINEEIEEYGLLNEGLLSDIGNMMRSFLKKIGHKSSKKSGDDSSDDDDTPKKKKKKKKKRKSKNKKEKKNDFRKKKIVGGTTTYDYHDYTLKNRRVSKADYDKLISMIDQDLTDIAAVAKKVFPRHTDEGAQSQLRKILNKERPMTSTVANKLRKMISKGQIAVKS